MSFMRSWYSYTIEFIGVITNLYSVFNILARFRSEFQQQSLNFNMVAELVLTILSLTYYAIKTTALFNTLWKDFSRLPFYTTEHHQNAIISDKKENQIIPIMIVEAHAIPALSYEEQPRARIIQSMKDSAQTVGLSGRFFDQMKPPTFSGKQEDFECWVRRFDWFIKTRSSNFSTCLAGYSDVPIGLSLDQLGLFASDAAKNNTAGHTAIRMGAELFAYLQASLQECGLDQALLPVSQGNGFEVWRMLHDRFKPHTATSALNDLKELVFHTDLYGGAGSFPISCHGKRNSESSKGDIRWSFRTSSSISSS